MKGTDEENTVPYTKLRSEALSQVKVPGSVSCGGPCGGPCGVRVTNNGTSLASSASGTPHKLR